jgi:uncharacterized protein YndB with AHSA1/START domain
MTAPLTMSFDVNCSVDHAFTVWTSKISTWWPTGHSVSGERDLEVVLQSGVGGRIYERTADGHEHDWGEVTVWEPPAKLVYLWHLAREREDATEVEIRFVATGDAHTRVEIEHRGWDGEADIWRHRNQNGWDSLLPHYLSALARPALDER